MRLARDDSRLCHRDQGARRSGRAEQLADAAERAGARILLPDDAEFPAQLRTIPDPPPVLFALGDLTILERPAVAIVGSRDHTAYGEVVGRTLAARAARAGLAVVSGMARGLDAVAHAAALDAGGATVGVLGNGIGVIYPAANRVLYERVAAGACSSASFRPASGPTPAAFRVGTVSSAGSPGPPS